MLTKRFQPTALKLLLQSCKYFSDDPARTFREKGICEENRYYLKQQREQLRRLRRILEQEEKRKKAIEREKEIGRRKRQAVERNRQTPKENKKIKRNK